MAKHNELGQIGEEIACKFLVKQGFSVICRNYLKKYGEIDIIAEKQGKIHFVEVKSVSCETVGNVSSSEVSDKYEKGGFRPEDNLHPQKIKRLSRVIQAYLLEMDVSDETEWQVDVLCVYVSMIKRVGRVKMLEDIIL
ncbi:MAG: YraN family protein [Minisyncoccia bacterium]